MRSIVACIALLVFGAVEVMAQAAPDIAVDPDAFDYGGIVVGNTRERSFVLTNEGTANLVVFEVLIQGPDAGAFQRLGGGGGFIVNPGGNRLITVRFNPSTVGPKQAALRIDSDDPDEPSFLVDLTGEGLGVPDIALSRTTLAFGNVTIGSTSALDLIVENVGTDALVISGTALMGTDPGLFSIERGQAPFTLAPQERDTITVSFTPTTDGDKDAVLQLVSNDPNESPFDVALQGRGVRPTITADTTRHDFGEVGVGASATFDFILTNDGAIDLLVDSLVVQGTDAAAFQVVSGGGAFALRPGLSRGITVQFAPTAGGPHQATLTVYSNDPDTPTLALSLAGAGVTAGMELRTASVDFGAVLVALSATRNVVVANSGKVDLVISQLAVSGGDSTAFVVQGGVPLTVAPSDSISLPVRFSPASAGAKASTLYIVGNDPDQPFVAVPLAGEGSTVQLDIPEAVPLEQDVAFSVTLPPSFQPVFSRLLYKEAGAGNFRTVSLEGSGPTYQGLIPGPSVTLRGVEYYLSFDDAQGTVITLPATTPQIRPLFLPARIDQFAAPDSIQAWTFRMISIPLELSDESLGAVLADDYGPYNTRKWRLFQWEQTLNNGEGDYVEYADIPGGFAPGASFWLVTNDGLPYSVENARSREPRGYNITLQPGWNQIGNPFAFTLRWPGGTIDPRIEAPVFFDGTGFLYDQTLLLPWEGYFVFNSADMPLTVTLSPGLSNGSAAKAAAPAASAWPTEEAHYLLQLAARVNGTPLRDTQNYLGFVDGAHHAYDAYDVTEAPPIGEFVRLSTVEQGERYAGNFKPMEDAGHHWDVVLDGTFSKKTVRVQLIGHGTLPEGYGVYVFDQDNRRALAVEDSSFSIDVEDASRGRHLRIVVGTAAYAADHRDGIASVPDAFRLEQNYPNPFNPETAIRYHLGEQRPVRIDIFNLMGQRVRTLVNTTQEAGSYTVQWDARNEAGNAVASGVYIYRLRAGTYTETRKMLLIR